MSYLSEEQLKLLDFKSIGKNVKISDKASIYDAEKIEIGNNSRIDDFCILSGSIKIGCNVHITPYCNLAGGIEGIIIGDFSGIGYRSTIMTQSDDYLGDSMCLSTVPAEYKNEIKKAVFIDSHCIVGAHSVIFPDVVLAEGTAIGACSLVLKSTEPWTIYVGIPAKKLKARRKGYLDKFKLYLERECF